MGRTEDRTQKKKGLSDRDIEAIKIENAYQRGYREGKAQAFDFMFYMTAYTLNSRLEYGEKRLSRVMHWIFNNIDSFRTGQLMREDFPEIKRQMCELGVVLYDK